MSPRGVGASSRITDTCVTWRQVNSQFTMLSHVFSVVLMGFVSASFFLKLMDPNAPSDPKEGVVHADISRLLNASHKARLPSTVSLASLGFSMILDDSRAHGGRLTWSAARPLDVTFMSVSLRHQRPSCAGRLSQPLRRIESLHYRTRQSQSGFLESCFRLLGAQRTSHRPY